MATTTTSSNNGESPKLQVQVDRARLESQRLRDLLTAERSAIRALKAAHSSELRKERAQARRREQELQGQLNQLQRAQLESSKGSDCEECNKIRNEYEAELRKERNETKKKEANWIAQVNELKSAKNANDKKNHSSECEDCKKIRKEFEVELKKEKNDSKKKELNLMTQLNDLKSNLGEDKNKSVECVECSKIRNNYEAELRKERNEAKKREANLMTQLNDIKNLQVKDKRTKLECEDCSKLRNNHESEIKKERNEFKRKEMDLIAQINELKNMKIVDKTIKECEECAKLQSLHEAELKKERYESKQKVSSLTSQINELKTNKAEPLDKAKKPECDCLKLKSHDTGLQKQQNEHKRKESALNSQIMELTKELNDSKWKLSDKIEETAKLRKNHEAELKKEKLESKRKESCLLSQLNELKMKINTVTNKKSEDCDQCVRYKAILEAELKKERTEFKKREADLQTQLANAHRINSDGKRNSEHGCEQCTKLNKDIGKQKDLIRELEEKIERIQEADRLKSVDLRSQHDRHVAELARVTRSHRQDARKLLEELKTKDRIIEQLKRNVQNSKKPAATDNGPMRKLRDGDRKIEHTAPPISTAAFDPKTDNNLYEKVSGPDIRNPRSPAESPTDRSSQVGAGTAQEQGPGAGCIQDNALNERLLLAEAEVTRLQRHLQHSEDVIQQLTKYNKDTDRRDQLTAKQRREMYYRSSGHELEPVAEEDCDSAVSSAPSSLSPQPYPGAPCFPPGAVPGGGMSTYHPALTTVSTIVADDESSPPPTSLSPQPPLSEAYTSPPESPPPPVNLGLGLDTGGGDVWGDKGSESELSIAKRQVRELEKALLVTRGVKNDSRHNQMTAALTERVKILEAREASLLHELGDLREQNELLEFRILELEECHDKWSLRSTTPPDTRDVWTDTESDSGVGSLCLEPEDKIRNRLLAISQSTREAEDKECLLRVVALLESLEALSKEQALYLEEKVVEPVLQPTQIKPQQFVYNPRERQPNRIVATVLPFTEYQQQIEEYSEERVRNDEELSDKPDDKKHIWNTLCLQESGIFEGDPPEFSSQGTQTDPFTIPEPNPHVKSPLDLTAEIQKLNQFRESIEVGKKTKKLLVSSDQKYLKEINFYKDRVDVLERKLQIFESSGDVQAKRLAERLNREVYLASQVKDLSSKVQKLHSENSRLEEERCELEEAENDTRLRCQQLEAEIEALTDRLKAMEDSKLAAKRKAKDAKSQATYWESMVNKYEERNYELEERECELRHRLEVMECTTPTILLFNMWKVMQKNPNLDMKEVLMEKMKDVGKSKTNTTSRSKSKSPVRCTCASAMEDIKQKIKTLESERDLLINQKQNVENRVKDLEKELRNLKNNVKGNSWGDQQSELSIKSSDIEIIRELEVLTEKEKEMKKRITELEHREMAYMETLQQADEIWAEMESSYKKRIGEAEESEHNLRQKLQKYEQPDERDDRIQELEETERGLKERVSKLEKEVQRLLSENKTVKDDLDTCVCNLEDKLQNVQAKYTGDIEKERKKCFALSEELKTSQKFKAEAGKAYEAEIDGLKGQLSKTRKELVHLDVTNSELREEVFTLESKISELEKEIFSQRAKDCAAIRALSQELKSKDDELSTMKKRQHSEQPCLCEEKDELSTMKKPHEAEETCSCDDEASRPRQQTEEPCGLRERKSINSDEPCACDDKDKQSMENKPLPSIDVCLCGDKELGEALQNDVSLNEMARRLSSALKSVERCVECAEAATPDLMQTVDGIRCLCEQMEVQSPGLQETPKAPVRRRWL